MDSPKKIFSATEIPGTVPLSCTIIPIPFSNAYSIESGFQASPLKCISPLSAFCIPATMEVTVDLPEPFSPMSPKISPRRTSISTSFNATVEPKVLVIFRTLTITSFPIIQLSFLVFLSLITFNYKNSSEENNYR